MNDMGILKIGCLVIFLVLTTMTNAQEIIAHRGASYIAPENTLASVKLGFELGADAVEVDVLLSKDNRLMVNHDKDTYRTAGGQNMIISETHSDQLRQLEVGSWKGAQYRGEKMPFLEEVLALVTDHQKLFIEFKTGPEVLPFFKKTIEDYKRRQNLVIISFNKETIIKSKQMFPDIPAYWLIHNYNQHKLEEAIKIALDNNMEGLNVHYKLINETFMNIMANAGIQVYTYTVNDPNEAKRLRALKVTGITTDRPQLLEQQIKIKP